MTYPRFRIKNVATLNNEVLHETESPYTEIKYVEIGDVRFNEGIINKTDYTFETAPSRARRKVRNGDVIISTVRTYLKAVAPVRNPEPNLIVSTGFAVVRPRFDILNPAFAGYFLQSEKKLGEIVSRSVGVSYPAINPEDIGNLEIFLPPLPIQKAIASFLDKETARIDALIEKKERQIELLQEKRQAIITRAVTKGLNPNAKMKHSGVEWIGEIPEGWAIRKIKYLSIKIGSGKTPKGGATVYQDSGVLLLRSQNIHFDGLKLDDVAYIDHETDDEMSGTRVIPNDVLLNITGASIGRSFFIPESFPCANVNQHVCIIRPRQRMVITQYLWLSLCSDLIQGAIWSGENGTSREGLTFEQIGNFSILVPINSSEQKDIVKELMQRLNAIDVTILKIRDSISLLQENRSSLITAAVSGQIEIPQEVVG